MRRTASGSAKSPTTMSAPASVSASRSRARSVLRAWTITWWPSRCKVSAVRRPRPSAEPVTRILTTAPTGIGGSGLAGTTCGAGSCCGDRPAELLHHDVLGFGAAANAVVERVDSSELLGVDARSRTRGLELSRCVHGRVTLDPTDLHGPRQP